MAKIAHGFRHDPMEWLSASRSVEAAQIRCDIIGAPQLGDDARLASEVERILATQAPDGSLGEETHGTLIRLHRLGCSPEREEVQRAVAFMCRRGIEERGALNSYELQVATRTGWEDPEGLRRSAQVLADEVACLDFWSMCPWTGEVHLQGLWAVRHLVDVETLLGHGLQTLLVALQEGRGWPIYLDPWGILECVGTTDHPLAREIAIAQLPLVLRAQHKDGSWGGDKHYGYGPENTTYVVFRTLAKWGLLDELQSLPPLPRDWDVATSLPAPQGDLTTMTWDGEAFWVFDRSASQAISVSHDGGSIRGSVPMPSKTVAIGWQGDTLLALQAEPQAILRIDPVDGRVTERLPLDVWGDVCAIGRLGERLCVGNLHMGGVHLIPGPETVEQHTRPLGGSAALDLAGADESIWHLDAFAPAIIRSVPEEGGRTIEWGERPFGPNTTGIAWDGERLWALDNGRKRICALEKRNDSTARC